jgi:hypothetical protein
MTAVLAVTLVAPIFSYYTIKKAKQKDFKTHKKIQTLIYIFCIAAILTLVLLIRFSGGVGSIFEDSSPATGFHNHSYCAYYRCRFDLYCMDFFNYKIPPEVYKNTSREIIKDP